MAWRSISMRSRPISESGFSGWANADAVGRSALDCSQSVPKSSNGIAADAWLKSASTRCASRHTRSVSSGPARARSVRPHPDRLHRAPQSDDPAFDRRTGAALVERAPFTERARSALQLMEGVLPLRAAAWQSAASDRWTTIATTVPTANAGPSRWVYQSPMDGAGREATRFSRTAVAGRLVGETGQGAEHFTRLRWASCRPTRRHRSRPVRLR